MACEFSTSLTRVTSALLAYGSALTERRVVQSQMLFQESILQYSLNMHEDSEGV